MILYSLEDKDGNIFELNGSLVSPLEANSLKVSGDTFTWQNRIVENSFLPGSSKVGISRLTSRELSFSLERAYNTDQEFRGSLNEYVYQLQKAVYLIDNTNNLRIKIVCSSYTSDPEPGTGKRFTMDKFIFTALEPFWESTTETTISNQVLTGSTFNDITINNQGFLETFPVLEFSGSVAVSDLLIQVPEINETLQIQDPLFGTSTYTLLEVDNRAGETMLSTLDRNAFIFPGTGFIKFPVGSSTLRIFPSANCTVTVKYRDRFYV